MERASQKLQEIEKYWKWYQINRYLGAIAGAVIYSLGINLFIVPVSLYSGGIMGFAQVIRTVLVGYLHLPFQNFDVAGVIYYLINAPILLLSMKRIGRRFFVKTVMCVTIVTVLLSVIPIPAQPILPEDTLACCVIGGIIYYIVIAIVLKIGLNTNDLKLFSALVVAVFLGVPYWKNQLSGKRSSKKDKQPKEGKADA